MAKISAPASRASWIAASHDGYVRRFGLIHRRRLFLARGGGDLRGEDRLLLPPGKSLPRRTAGKPFAIRFHLHPAVAVGEPVRGPMAGTVIPFGNDLSGPWEFAIESRQVTATVEESFYLGRGRPETTKQIVISGTVGGDAGAGHRGPRELHRARCRRDGRSGRAGDRTGA